MPTQIRYKRVLGITILVYILTFNCATSLTNSFLSKANRLFPRQIRQVGNGRIQAGHIAHMNRKSMHIASNQQNDSVEEELPLVAKDDKSLVSPENQVTWRQYGVLVMLLLSFTSNQWCRQLINYLCNFSSGAANDGYLYINAALNFNQEYYAALASFAFTSIFSLFSLFGGSIADRYDRKSILAISAFFWSLMTLLQSFVTDKFQLIPTRVLLGAAQAFFNPAAYTILSDIFPSTMLARVNSVLSSGVYVGGGLASLSILLDNMYGWRQTMIIAGGIGILVALLGYVVVPEPRNFKVLNRSTPSKTVTDISSDKSLDVVGTIQNVFDSLREVINIPEVRSLLFASLLRFAAGFTIAIWKAPFVFEKYPGNEELFSSSNAFIITVGGLISSLLGGIIADKLSSSTPDSLLPSRSRLWVPAIGSLLAIPAWSLFILADNPSVAAASLLVEYLVAECWIGPTLASLYSAVPVNRRGTTQGIFSLLVAIANLAPFFVGLLSGGTWASFSIGDSVLWTVNIAYLVSGISFILAAVKDDAKISKAWANSKGS